MSRNAKAFEKIRVVFADIREHMLDDMVEALAKAAEVQVVKQFASDSDPDGKPWAPVKRRNRPLHGRTGRLASSFVVQRIAKVGFRISTPLFYARMNQAARNMLPKQRRVGRAWSRELRKAAKAVLKKHTAKAKRAKR